MMIPRRLVPLPIKNLRRLLSGLQQRAAGIQPEVVAEYREVLHELDAPVVYQMTEDGEIGGQRVKAGDMVVADGFHTIEAADKEDKKEIQCELRDGTPDDCFDFSLRANRRHGLQRTRADTRRAIMAAVVRNEKYAKGWSSRVIAEKVGTTHTKVLDVIREMKESAEGLEFSSKKGKKGAKEGKKATGGRKGKTPADAEGEEAYEAEPPDFGRAKKAAAEISERIARETPEERPEHREGVREGAARAIEDAARFAAVLGVLEKHERRLAELWEDVAASG